MNTLQSPISAFPFVSGSESPPKGDVLGPRCAQVPARRASFGENSTTWGFFKHTRKTQNTKQCTAKSRRLIQNPAFELGCVSDLILEYL